MLERWVGVKLIDRKSRGATTTPAAARFVPDIRRLIKDTYAIRNHIQAEALADSKIRVVMQHTLMMTHFPSLLRQLQSTHPSQSFDVRTGNFDWCFNQLDNDKADLAICFVTDAETPPTRATRLKQQCIDQERLIPVATPEVAASVEDKPSDKQLLDLLQYPESSFLGRAVRRECLPDLMQRYTVQVVCESAFTAGLKAMALAGMGIAWLPFSLVCRELTEKLLLTLDDVFPSVSFGIAIYR